MKIEIIEVHEDTIVFYVDQTPCSVNIETEINVQQYPVSFNSFNDQITYAEEDIIYHYVLENTLQIEGDNLEQPVNWNFDASKVCSELENILNNEQ